MLLVVVVRLAWRRRQPPPPTTATGWEAKLAHVTHHTLYAFLFLAPLAGYLASSFTPYALKFFGVEIPKAGWPDESLNAFFKQLHQIAVWGGGGLIFSPCRRCL
jgi:cytochrome b561